MYKIGLFSQITQITVKALRYYDEEGLFKPSHVDPVTGYRYYGTEQLVDIHRIIELRQIGFSIEEIALLLRGRNTQAILKRKKSELEHVLNETRERLLRLTYFTKLSQSEQDSGSEKKSMNFNAVIKTTPECIVYSKRFIAPDYNSYSELIPAIGKEVERANPGLKCSEPPYCFIEYLDGEYKETNIDVEFCEAVEKIGKETQSIKFKKLPSITVVSVMMKGAYSNFSDAYLFAFRWIDANGYKVDGNPRESYIDGIWNRENDADWLTELQIPVVKK